MNAKKNSSDVNQSDPKRRQHGHRDCLKSYTPQIRYTKLEFKVTSSLSLKISFFLFTYYISRTPSPETS